MASYENINIKIVILMTAIFDSQGNDDVVSFRLKYFFLNYLWNCMADQRISIRQFRERDLGKWQIKLAFGDFPGGPVAKTPHSQFRGPRFNPWSGN